MARPISSGVGFRAQGTRGQQAQDGDKEIGLCANEQTAVRQTGQGKNDDIDRYQRIVVWQTPPDYEGTDHQADEGQHAYQAGFNAKQQVLVVRLRAADLAHGFVGECLLRQRGVGPRPMTQQRLLLDQLQGHVPHLQSRTHRRVVVLELELGHFLVGQTEPILNGSRREHDQQCRENEGTSGGQHPSPGDRYHQQRQHGDQQGHLASACDAEVGDAGGGQDRENSPRPARPQALPTPSTVQTVGRKEGHHQGLGDVVLEDAGVSAPGVVVRACPGDLEPDVGVGMGQGDHRARHEPVPAPLSPGRRVDQRHDDRDEQQLGVCLHGHVDALRVRHAVERAAGNDQEQRGGRDGHRTAVHQLPLARPVARQQPAGQHQSSGDIEQRLRERDGQHQPHHAPARQRQHA